MARLPYLDKADLPPEHQDILARGINLHRMLVHSPNAARAFSGLGSFIRWKSGLDARLRELAILQVGWIARSPYEWSHHVKIAQEFGCSESDIRAIPVETDRKDSGLDPLARTVLRGAREMTDDLAMTDATFAELEKALGREHLMDLVTTIAFYNAVVRVLATMQIDVEPSYQPYLDAFPLPATSNVRA